MTISDSTLFLTELPFGVSVFVASYGSEHRVSVCVPVNSLPVEEAANLATAIEAAVAVARRATTLDTGR